tara:strand:+ start:2945 stop:3166 length:222 start_codon:yes stop_codon:yes gene_type:complete
MNNIKIEIDNIEICYECSYNTFNEECDICNTGFNSNDIQVGKCRHAFHINCINEWLKRSKTCPYCRVPWIVLD